MYSCIFSTKTPHILSSPSFIFLQAVHDCIAGATADLEAATCFGDCLEGAVKPVSCDESCGTLETCHTECFTDGATCKTEMYANIDCLTAAAGGCDCAAAFDADATPFALNLAHRLSNENSKRRRPTRKVRLVFYL